MSKPNQPKEPALIADEKSLRFLGYGLPRAEKDAESRNINGNGFTIHEVPLGATASFLDYDGVILFAGSFEVIDSGRMFCKAPADLDHREREFFTALKQNIPFVFLVPEVPATNHSDRADKFDLFRRVARKSQLHGYRPSAPNATLESSVPEFREYMKLHGTGYMCFAYGPDYGDSIIPICSESDQHYGLICGQKLFVLPCTTPERTDQVRKACLNAVDAVIRYRHRVSEKLPEWALSFSFCSENDLREMADAKRKELADLDARVDSYTNYKGALAYKSDPLVQVVSHIFDHFFGVKLNIDDKFIEDATLRMADGAIAAVFEIKGVKGNFSRANVNQVDSHRERLNLPTDTPGVLIMNTFMDVASLRDKDQAPHPDIIKKAFSDRVLMMRTLDLLRFADGVERNTFEKEAMRKLILNDAGWLKVIGNTLEIIKG